MRTLLISLSLLAISTTATAEERATNPIGYQWLVTACANWNCASEALAAAKGDGNTVALPTSSADFPWIVLRRVEQGSVYVPPDGRFDVESFDGIAEAAARWASIDADRAPVLVTSTGNAKLVVSMRIPGPTKQRGVRH